MKNITILPLFKCIALLKLPLDISINALVIPQRLHSTLNWLFEIQVGVFFKTVCLSAKNGNKITIVIISVIIVHTINNANFCSLYFICFRLFTLSFLNLSITVWICVVRDFVAFTFQFYTKLCLMQIPWYKLHPHYVYFLLWAGYPLPISLHSLLE